MKSKRKDREYMAILDQPIKELKKPVGQPADFDNVITQLLNTDKRKVNSKSEGQQPLEHR